MHRSRSKIPSKNIVRQRCVEGFNSGVKGLIVRGAAKYVFMDPLYGTCFMKPFGDQNV
jgi:hypothetical protein